ncbi:hypothetical protein Q7O_003573 [Pectobacterium carotovorum subsp. carotovorum PCCS1]|nr:hypothetical protein [Pectobacterium carotovorum subsp. carotovorum PCCS1]
MTECSKWAIANTSHWGCYQTIGKLKLSNVHRQKLTILCLQGRVYYAFFTSDERPNFDQFTAIDQ